MDRSLFFLILSMCCVWLVIDNAIGNHHVNTFLATLFPFMAGD